MKFLSVVTFLSIFSYQSAFANEKADLNGWGFDVGFGQQSYTEDVLKVGGITPYLFSWAKEKNHSRIALDYVLRDFQSLSNAVKTVHEVSMSLRTDAEIFQGLVSAYSKIGLGVMLFDEDLYDGTPITLPVSIGLNVITGFGEKFGASTFYIEYRLNNMLNYKEEDSLPNQPGTVIDGDNFSTNTILLGINFIF